MYTMQEKRHYWPDMVNTVLAGVCSTAATITATRQLVALPCWFVRKTEHMFGLTDEEQRILLCARVQDAHVTYSKRDCNILFFVTMNRWILDRSYGLINGANCFSTDDVSTHYAVE